MFYPYLEGFHTWRLYLLYWCTIIYSAVAILAQITFHIIWGIEGKGWILAHSWWAKLVGFARYLNYCICCIDFCCVHVHVLISMSTTVSICLLCRQYLDCT